jgi:hypothetical protein
MEIIRTTYAYNYKHNKVSLKVILAELAKAHLVRTLKDAPPPGTAMANLVADTIKQLKTMTGDILHEQYNEDDTVLGYNTESAFGATTDDSSVDTKSRKSKRKKRVAKQKTRMKLAQRRQRKRRRMIVPTARNSIDAAHTPTY